MLPTNYLTGTQTIDLVARGEVKLEEVIADHQVRYASRGDDLKAWVTVKHEQAKLDLEKDRLRGDLAGMIVGVKDIINTKDMPTEHGSQMYKDHQPGVDAAVVTILRQAGATIIGKTATHEFAYGAMPDTLNPFDQSRDAGGSSVGSAVSVCDYQCHVGVGTQTSGSLLRPASNAGVSGFKPTWGRISVEGVKPLSPIFDTIGFHARNVQDIQLVCHQFGIVRDLGAPAPEVLSLRLGFAMTDLLKSAATDDLRAVWDEAKECLRSAGASVTDIELPKAYDGLSGVRSRLSKKLLEVDAGFNMLSDYMKAANELSDSTRRAVEKRFNVPSHDMLALADELAALRPGMDAFLSQFDAVITPTTSGEPRPTTEKADPAVLIMWTGLHVPMINVPGLASSEGLPIGLTLVGPRYGDEKLLQVAKAVSKVWIDKGQDKMLKIPAPEGAIHLQP